MTRPDLTTVTTAGVRKSANLRESARSRVRPGPESLVRTWVSRTVVCVKWVAAEGELQVDPVYEGRRCQPRRRERSPTTTATRSRRPGSLAGAQGGELVGVTFGGPRPRARSRMCSPGGPTARCTW